MYGRTSTATSINAARLVILARKQKSYDAILPSYSALRENTNQAAYQAGIIGYRHYHKRLKLVILQTGVGYEMMVDGRLLGQPSLQL